jgi:hypothetical protein
MQVRRGRAFRGVAPFLHPCWIGAGFTDLSSPAVAPGYPYRAGLALAVSGGLRMEQLGWAGVGRDGNGPVGQIASVVPKAIGVPARTAGSWARACREQRGPREARGSLAAPVVPTVCPVVTKDH